MTVQCPRCRTQYKIPSARINDPRPVFKCTRCSLVFSSEAERPARTGARAKEDKNLSLPFGGRRERPARAKRDDDEPEVDEDAPTVRTGPSALDDDEDEPVKKRARAAAVADEDEEPADEDAADEDGEEEEADAEEESEDEEDESSDDDEEEEEDDEKPARAARRSTRRTRSDDDGEEPAFVARERAAAERERERAERERERAERERERERLAKERERAERERERERAEREKERERAERERARAAARRRDRDELRLRDDDLDDEDDDELEDDEPPRPVLRASEGKQRRPPINPRRGIRSATVATSRSPLRPVAIGVTAIVVVYMALAVALERRSAAAIETLSQVPVLGRLLGGDHLLVWRLQLNDVEGGLDQIKGGRPAYVVSGRAINTTNEDLRVIEIEGRLLANGVEQRRQTVYAANQQRKTIQDLSPSEIEMLLRLEPNRRFVIRPGESASFLLVFPNPPPGTTEVTCRVVSARTA